MTYLEASIGICGEGDADFGGLTAAAGHEAANVLGEGGERQQADQEQEQCSSVRHVEQWVTEAENVARACFIHVSKTR